MTKGERQTFRICRNEANLALIYNYVAILNEGNLALLFNYVAILLSSGNCIQGWFSLRRIPC